MPAHLRNGPPGRYSRETNRGDDTMRIVPAILTDSFADFREMVKLTSSFTDWFQVDLMDGKFVPSKSISIEHVGAVKIPPSANPEVHLMMEEPREYYSILKEAGYGKIIFHYEAVKDALRELHEVRVWGMEGGVALNPETSIADIVHLVPDLDTILLLSVNPGYYGSPFIEDVLEKAREAHDRYPFITLGIDGGIGLENLEIVRDAGLDYACVGSRIFSHADPAAAYRELCELAGI